MDFKKVDGEGRKLDSSYLVDEGRSYHSNDFNRYAGEKDGAVFDDSHEAGGGGKITWKMIGGESRLWIHYM